MDALRYNTWVTAYTRSAEIAKGQGMLVAIVTVFNEVPNYGSYLQAFALQEWLRRHGCQSELLEERSFVRTGSKILSILSRDPRGLAFNLKRSVIFAQANKRLSRRRLDKGRSYDVALLGSDEIWNLRNRTFIHSPMYFGAGINATFRVAYAPSCNGMSYRGLAGTEWIRESMLRIDHLSGRDPCTLDLIKCLTSRDAVEVLDPTFLVDWEGYERQTLHGDHILVYCYALDVDRLRLIRELAEGLARDIVFVGHYSALAPDVLLVDPWTFLGHLRSACFVVTDSYHGTILSVQYRKRFCSFAGNNYKVRSALASFHLEDRDATSATSLLDVERREIHYDMVTALVAQRKKVSEEFLEEALGLRT